MAENQNQNSTNQAVQTPVAESTASPAAVAPVPAATPAQTVSPASVAGGQVFSDNMQNMETPGWLKEASDEVVAKNENTQIVDLKAD